MLSIVSNMFLNSAAGADAETIENIKNVLVSKRPCRIKLLAAPKQEKLSLGNILPLNLGESLVAPEAKVMLDGLLNLTCHLESRSENDRKVRLLHPSDSCGVLLNFLLDLLAQFSAARTDEKDIQ